MRAVSAGRTVRPARPAARVCCAVPRRAPAPSLPKPTRPSPPPPAATPPAADTGVSDSAVGGTSDAVDHVAAVQAALADPNTRVWAQTAPAVRVAISEEFGLPPGFASPGQLVAALRALGCDRVYDVTLGADLTILEESSELVARIAEGGGGDALPLFTSCCPGWIGYGELKKKEKAIDRHHTPPHTNHPPLPFHQSKSAPRNSSRTCRPASRRT